MLSDISINIREINGADTKLSKTAYRPREKCDINVKMYA